MPNGREIFHLNKIETDFIYKEIFTNNCYLKNGITIEPGDIVFDVGANIGLFSLYAISKCPDCQVYSFEPIKPIFDVLKANTESHRSQIQIFHSGIADCEKQVEFVFYPSMSVFSGQFANEEMDTNLLRDILINQYRSSVPDEKLLNRFIDSFLDSRFDSSSWNCSLNSISYFMKKARVDKIDLLKVDVEKSEFEVLRGISDEDWGRIKQLVMEVHNLPEEEFCEIKDLLLSKGFTIIEEKEADFSNVNVINLFARRVDA